MAAVTKPRVERTRPTELIRLDLDGVIRIPRFQRGVSLGTGRRPALFEASFAMQRHNRYGPTRSSPKCPIL
jgi:hypothetical protein